MSPSLRIPSGPRKDGLALPRTSACAAIGAACARPPARVAAVGRWGCPPCVLNSPQVVATRNGRNNCRPSGIGLDVNQSYERVLKIAFEALRSRKATVKQHELVGPSNPDVQLARTAPVENMKAKQGLRIVRRDLVHLAKYGCKRRLKSLNYLLLGIAASAFFAGVTAAPLIGLRAWLCFTASGALVLACGIVGWICRSERARIRQEVESINRRLREVEKWIV